MPETEGQQALLDQPVGARHITEELPTVRGPVAEAWRGFRKSKLGVIGLVILIVLYVMALFADFIAPYAADDQNRDLQWSPPTHLHFRGADGFSLRPFIYPIRSYIDENFNVKQQEDKTQRCYMRFFVRRDAHKFLNLIPMRLRLFGFDDPNVADVHGGATYYTRYYLMGGDISGRDIFSRISYGARISMTIGLIGSFLVLIIGLLVGGISGYAGGWIDDLLQRLCETIMLLPGFF